MSGAAQTIDALGAAIEAAIIDASVRVLDRRAAALRASTGVDSATLAHRARVADALEAAAADVQAMMGPLVPAQGQLALLRLEAP